MKMRLVAVSASVALASLAFTLAHAQPAKKVKKKVNTSLGARTAACKKDCSAGHLHGTYRAYGSIDPELKSPESRKLYAECVRLCLDRCRRLTFRDPLSNPAVRGLDRLKQTVSVATPQ